MYWSPLHEEHPEINNLIPTQAVNVQVDVFVFALFVLLEIKLLQVTTNVDWEGFEVAIG